MGVDRGAKNQSKVHGGQLSSKQIERENAPPSWSELYENKNEAASQQACEALAQELLGPIQVRVSLTGECRSDDVIR